MSATLPESAAVAAMPIGSRARTTVIQCLCGLCAGVLALGATFVSPPSGNAADYPQEEAQRELTQPGNNAPVWREVRSGEPQTTTVHGVESGVLIQSSGQTWRAVRPYLASAGGLLLALAVGALAAFYHWRGPIGVEGEPAGRLIERFDAVDRVLHWMMGLSFAALAISGLVLTFGKFLLLPLMGYTLFSWLAMLAKNIHNFTGPIFLLSLPFFIARYLRDNLPRLCDIDWMLKFGGMLSRKHVPSGRFNAGEKTLYWGLVCFLSVVLAASGLVLDFPNFGQGRGVMQLANVVHVSAALLAVAAALFHIYLGTVGVEGAYEAMRYGYVDETWAREHHELWYRDVRSGKSRQHLVVASRPQAHDVR
ncbi:MAG: formate dehydrogenase subunit gamma [Burkholderiales bacterium]